MNENSQKQKAGNGSTNLQIGQQNNTYVNGVTLSEVRELIADKIPVVIGEAKAATEQRFSELLKVLLPVLNKPEILSGLSLPENQAVLRLVAEQVTGTDDINDYRILSEFLSQRIQNNGDKVKTTNIEYAIRTIKDLSDEGLLVLSVVGCFFHFTANALKIEGVLQKMNDLYAAILKGNHLPINNSWLEHLDLLKTIRINTVVSSPKFEDVFNEQYSYLLEYGILRGSEQHIEALKLLDSEKMTHLWFSINQRHPEYLLIKIPSLEYIKNISKSPVDGTPFTDSQKQVLSKIVGMYDSKKETLNFLVDKIKEYPELSEVRDWWNQHLSPGFQLTQMGIVIANSNVHQMNPDLPPMIEELS